MPHEQMDAKQVAEYLDMDLRKVVRLAARGKIPARKIAGRFVFYKGQIDHWVEAQMHELSEERLAGIEKGVSDHHGFDYDELLVCSLIPQGGIAVPLAAKTSDSAVRALVDLAVGAEVAHHSDDLIRHIRQREQLCSTAMIPGVAIPHPRTPLPHDIAASFVVVGLTSSGIPYGAVDGSLTRLFFLICCKDERTHLHVLARLGRVLCQTGAVESLLAAGSAAQMRELIEHREQSVTGGQ